MSDDIKWNTKKHDDNSDERAKKRLIDELARMFSDWKRTLCAQKRTQHELIDAIESLKLKFQAVITTAKATVDEEFIQFTNRLIDEQTAKVLADSFMEKNSITQYIPKYGVDGQAPESDEIIFMADRLKKAIPRRFSFKTPREFYEIPFVRAMAGLEGFLCFVRDADWVRGVFKNGEVIALGQLSNMIGVETMVTQEQFQSEVRKLPEPKPPAAHPPKPSDPAAPAGESFAT